MKDNFVTVSFRVSKEEAKQVQYIADVLYQEKRLKKPSMGLLAKSCLFTMSNLFKQIQYSAFLQKTNKTIS